MVFSSKVDGWLAGLSVALPLALLVTLLTGPVPRHGFALLPLLVLLAAIGLVSWVFLSTYYEFEHDALVAHSGPFSWRVPLHLIEAVEPTRSSRSAPALSLDRLAIRYSGGRLLLISPADRDGFLQLLHRRVPHLQP